MKIGIFTSGGDCPGLNAVIRGAVLKGVKTDDITFIGFRDGWRGVLEKDFIELPRHRVRGLSKVGGTILGTSRTNPQGPGGGPDTIRANLKELGVDALIAIGGEGTLAGAKELTDAGLQIVGVPKTIDNDLNGTDYTFGFDTAVQIATDAMDRLRTTGESHHRTMVAEVMGRNVGWIALHSGMATGAHVILIPEQQTPLKEAAYWVKEAWARGRAPLVVVSEGYVPSDRPDLVAERGVDSFGRKRLGGVGELIAPELAALTGLETRATTLGHIQRGGAPSAFDRVLATRLGMAAVQAVLDKKWGYMVAVEGTFITQVPFEAALNNLKTVPAERFEEAAALFG